MKIDDRSQPIPLNAYKSLASMQVEGSGNSRLTSSSRSDKVELSDYGRTVQQAAATLKQMPEVRQSLVGRVRKAVDMGTYRVDAEKTASGMLREGFENQVVMARIDLLA